MIVPPVNELPVVLVSDQFEAPDLTSEVGLPLLSSAIFNAKTLPGVAPVLNDPASVIVRGPVWLLKPIAPEEEPIVRNPTPEASNVPPLVPTFTVRTAAMVATAAPVYCKVPPSNVSAPPVPPRAASAVTL